MRYLITAGPTREAIDDVRFISNRSSGRLGIALAHAACEAGHAVTLLLGPGIEMTPPETVTVLRFVSAADLQALLRAQFPAHDVLVMAAAVADYRPAQRIDGKLPRKADGTLQITLEPTPDLVAEAAACRRPDQLVIAFALGPAASVQMQATEKLHRKGVDAIVANPLETMDATTIEATWIDAEGNAASSGRVSKVDGARWLVARIDAMPGPRNRPSPEG